VWCESRQCILVVLPPLSRVHPFPPSISTPARFPAPQFVYRANAMAETHKPQSASSPDVEEDMSIGRYIATRLPSLVPPMNPAPNPLKALTLLNRQQWLFFSVCSLKLLLHAKY